MGITQGAVSKLEDSDAPPLDTLRAAVTALGGRLDVRVRMGTPERVVVLKFPRK